MNDDMLFDDDEVAAGGGAPLPPWQVLIVDDEVSVHQVTQLVMADFRFDGRGVDFIDCYSAAEARAVLAQPNEVALILLDVVMEHEHAGLDLVRYVRDELGNRKVRIVLRTGQPGQAPQAQVIQAYDINDYREKTDLTHARLSTVFYAALRAHRDLTRLEGEIEAIQGAAAHNLDEALELLERLLRQTGQLRELVAHQPPL